ncbi:hypothetical protein [Paratractidigestivibacter sp.]|uniref:hypothetical protein n=1 Tax=Paratractidigestivibacter sp. TaxID=2847316 RepID=UPI002ABE2EE3|nr:hypothetical protein [Paratractidigestivibacter sp.]
MKPLLVTKTEEESIDWAHTALRYAIYIGCQALILHRKFQARILLEVILAFSIRYLVDFIASPILVNPQVVFDVSHVVASIVGSLLILRDISGFGAMTIVSALFLGRTINAIMGTVGERA